MTGSGALVRYTGNHVSFVATFTTTWVFQQAGTLETSARRGPLSMSRIPADNHLPVCTG